MKTDKTLSLLGFYKKSGVWHSLSYPLKIKANWQGLCVVYSKTGQRLGMMPCNRLSHFELKKMAGLVAGADAGDGVCGGTAE